MLRSRLICSLVKNLDSEISFVFFTSLGLVLGVFIQASQALIIFIAGVNSEVINDVKRVLHGRHVFPGAYDGSWASTRSCSSSCCPS